MEFEDEQHYNEVMQGMAEAEGEAMQAEEEAKMDYAQPDTITRPKPDTPVQKGVVTKEMIDASEHGEVVAPAQSEQAAPATPEAAKANTAVDKEEEEQMYPAGHRFEGLTPTEANFIYEGKIEKVDKQRLVEDLRKLPLAIFELGRGIYSRRKKLDEIITTMKQIESQIAIDVEMEVDAEKKKMFSNADKRQRETRVRLSAHKGQQELQGRCDDLKDGIDNKTIMVDFLKRRFRATESMARLLGGVQ